MIIGAVVVAVSFAVLDTAAPFPAAAEPAAHNLAFAQPSAIVTPDFEQSGAVRVGILKRGQNDDGI